jgi:hypothetical protein
MEDDLLDEVLPVLGIMAIRIGDLINDAFVLLDQSGKLIVGNGRVRLRSELSFVASLFDGDAEKITTLGQSFRQKDVGH